MTRLRYFARLFLVVLAVAAAQPAFAQRAKEQEGGDRKAEADYSRQALLEIFLEEPDLIPEKGPFDSGVVFERGPVRYRFMPIIAPFVMSAFGSMDTTPMPVVDPMVITGMSMPYDAGSYENRYEKWRIRRMLRKNIEAANRKDNQK